MPNSHLALLVLLLAPHVLTWVGLGWVLYMFRKQRRFIGSLSDDASRARLVTPELVKVWKKKLVEAEPGSDRWKAYRAALIKVGQYDGD